MAPQAGILKQAAKEPFSPVLYQTIACKSATDLDTAENAASGAPRREFERNV